MIGSFITRANALFLAIAGLALLFASDVILHVLISSYPVEGDWIGQVLGAALLAIAAFNYFQRSALIGGIYGRGLVTANMTFHFIAAIVVWKSLGASTPGPALLLAATVTTGFAIAYGWLLYRGPFERDLQLQRGAAQLASDETKPTIKP